ncbi:MAM domain-containing glycosylphosphatidylinositol anchor protein 2-like [Saccoglossus kowalevskii]
MAYDDFIIREGPCPGRTSVDFEHGLNNWFNIKDDDKDQFDWLISSGESPYVMTGPTIDHTKGTTEGKYGLCDMSGGLEGDKAILQASAFAMEENCITFWYHMYGEHIGELRVLMIDSSTGEEFLLWSLEGQQNERDEWKEARVGFRRAEETKLAHVIEVVRGAGDDGYIAIDDILTARRYCAEVIPPEASISDKSKSSSSE